MKSTIATLLALVVSASVLASPTRDEALSAIAILEKDPLSPDATEAAKTISLFAGESDEVRFILGPETIPWITDETQADDLDYSIRTRLFAVYFAGNAKSQLAAKKADDDPYSGWIAAIRAYRQIQRRHPIVIPSLERLSDMEANGLLQAHALEVMEKYQKPNQPPQTTPVSAPR